MFEDGGEAAEKKERKNEGADHNKTEKKTALTNSVIGNRKAFKPEGIKPYKRSCRLIEEKESRDG